MSEKPTFRPFGSHAVVNERNGDLALIEICKEIALIGTALVTPIAIAQKTVSFHTDDGGVIFADLYGAGERFVPAFAG